MSSDNPPYPYYNGIPFNPSFFTSTTDTGSGLTETAANALYLRKTVTDTATALETFNEGIVTPSISSTGSLSIATEVSAGTVNIGSGENILSIEGLITSINESGAQQTNIGTNVVGSSTNINSRAIAIANGTNFQGTVNIMNGETSTGTINIGVETALPAPSYTETNLRGQTYISQLATPITPVYTYPVLVAGQIGYVYPTIVGTNNISVQDRIFKELLSQAVPSGVFLVSAYYRAYTTATPTFSAIQVGPSVGTQPDTCSIITNSAVTPTSCVTCFLNYSAPGIIYSSAFIGASGSIVGSTCILKVMRMA
jgi:hypothetical protein